MISVGIVAFTDGLWKIQGTLVSSTPLFRKRFLQILVVAIHLALDVVGLNILDSIISTAREYYWIYIEFLSSSRLSWRRTGVFLKIYLFIAKRDPQQSLGTSDTLSLR